MSSYTRTMTMAIVSFGVATLASIAAMKIVDGFSEDNQRMQEVAIRILEETSDRVYLEEVHISNTNYLQSPENCNGIMIELDKIKPKTTIRQVVFTGNSIDCTHEGKTTQELK